MGKKEGEWYESVEGTREDKEERWLRKEEV